MKLPAYHEDPSVRAVNSIDEELFPVYASLEEALAGGSASSRFFALNDVSFRLFPSIDSIPDDAVSEFYGDTDSVRLSDPLLPWQAAGAEKTAWISGRLPIPCDPPFVPNASPAGLYTADLTLHGVSDRRVLLRVPGAISACWIFVNGREAGFLKGRTSRVFDLTELVYEGSNRVSAVVSKYSDDTYLCSPEGFEKSGLLGNATVYTVCESRISHLDCTTEISDLGRSVSVTVTADTEDDFTVSIFDSRGREVSKAQNCDKEGSAVCPIEKPIFWSPEDPYLYTVVICHGSDYIRLPLGLKTADVVDGRLITNLRPADLRCVKYRSFSKNALVADRTLFESDLRKIKDCNANAVVACDLLPDEFYTSADRAGIYVISALPADFSAYLSCPGSPGLDERMREGLFEACLTFAASLAHHPSAAAFYLPCTRDGEFTEKITAAFKERGIPLLDGEALQAPFWCDELLGGERQIGQKDGLVSADRTPKPLLLSNLRAAYAPVSFSAGETETQYFVKNLRTNSYLSDLEIVWEVTRYGKVEQSGSFGVLTVPPQGERLVTLPQLPCDGVCRVTLSALSVGVFGREAKRVEATASFPLSRELYVPTRLDIPAAGTTITETEQGAFVTGQGFSVSFDRISGGICSYVLAGNELMSGCSGCSLYLPVGNGSLARRSYLFGGQTVKVRAFEAEALEDGSCRVRISFVLTEKGRVPCISAETVYTVLPSGSILADLKVSLTDDAPIPDCLGLTFPLSTQLYAAEWYGMGPDECYPDLRGTCSVGHYKSTSRKMLGSESDTALSGMRCPVSFVAARGRDGNGLMFSGEELSFSMLPVSPCDRSKGQRRYDDSSPNWLTAAAKMRNALSDEGAFYENEASCRFVIDPVADDKISLWSLFLSHDTADDAAKGN